MAVNLDTLALPMAEELLGCLCEALAATTAGPTCTCCLAVGPAPMDNCCECSGGSNGQGWVRVVRVYPSGNRFPDQAFDVDTCDGNSWAVELELGAYRCVSTLDDSGQAPSCEQLRHDVEVILDDAAAMRAAVNCCFREGDRLLVVGEWQSIGPQGGCAGGSMKVTVQAYDCCPD